MEDLEAKFPPHWQKSFNIGVPVVDEQRQRLHTLIQEMEHLQSTTTIVKQELLAASFYKLAHFAGDQLIREEMYLQDIGSEKLHDYKALHDDFFKQIFLFQKRIEAGENSLAQILSYLKSWFVEQYVDLPEKD